MPFPTILSAGDKTKIREGNYFADVYLLCNPNDEVFVAQINQTVFASAFAEITFDGVTVGAITDVLDGFSVYIGDTQDIRAASFIGRARGDQGAGTILKINETSSSLQNNQWITVIKDIGLNEKLGRFNEGVITVDWDQTFRLLRPYMTNAPSVQAIILSGGIADFTFPGTAVASNSGASISTHLWSPDGGSFTGGTNSASAQPQIEYNSPGVYWPRDDFTDNNGVSNFFTFPVFVLSATLDDAFIFTGVESVSITDELGSGYNATLNYFSDELEDLAPSTLAVILTLDHYGSDTSPIIDNIEFIGRFKFESPQAEVSEENSVILDTGFQLEGVLAQMGEINSPIVALTNVAAPSIFGEITALTPWRGLVYIASEYSTLSNIHSLLFGDVSDTFENWEEGTEERSLLDSLNNMMRAINGTITQAAQGELQIERDARFLPSSDRSSLPTITTFTVEDLLSFSLTLAHKKGVGKAEGFGGFYNTTSGELQVLKAEAPAIASGRGQRTTELRKQLLTADSTLASAKTELEQRTANQLAFKNPFYKGVFGILDGYHFLSASNAAWYLFVISTEFNNRDISFDATTRWLLVSVTKIYDNELGSWTTQGRIEEETEDLDAQTVSQIPPGDLGYPLSITPPINAYPGFPTTPGLFLPNEGNEDPEDSPPIEEGEAEEVLEPEVSGEVPSSQEIAGNVVAAWNATQLHLCTNFGVVAFPNWRNKTPPIPGDHFLTDFKFDPNNNSGYALSNNGSVSTFWKTGNILSDIPSWESVELGSHIFQSVAPTGELNKLYAYGAGSGAAGTVYDFAIDNGGWIAGIINTPAGGIYIAGTFWSFTNVLQGFSKKRTIDIRKLIGATTITSIEMVYNLTKGTIEAPDFSFGIVFYLNAGAGPNAVETVIFDDLVDGTDLIHRWDGSFSNATQVEVKLTSDDFSGAGGRIGVCRIKKITLNGSAAMTVYSDDGGDSFEDAVRVGISPGTEAGASALITASIDKVLAASENFINEATGGGEYSEEADGDVTGTYALAIFIRIDEADLSYVFGTAAFLGGESLFSVEGGARIAISPEVAAVKGTLVSPNSVHLPRIDETFIAVLALFSGVLKLAMSSDGGIFWTASGSGVSGSANYIRVKNTKANQIYIADGNTIKYSSDGGVSLVSKAAPSASLLGVEVK